VKLRYHANVIEQRPQGSLLSPAWTLPARDLGCTPFEPGDRFTEYYYTDRWLDIQEVVSASGRCKGWYGDIAEPVRIENNQMSLVDRALDVWVNAEGQPLLLEEDEFETSSLSEAHRHAARWGVQVLLEMLEACEDAFADLRYQKERPAEGDPLLRSQLSNKRSCLRIPGREWLFSAEFAELCPVFSSEKALPSLFPPQNKHGVELEPLLPVSRPSPNLSKLPMNPLLWSLLQQENKRRPLVRLLPTKCRRASPKEC
jgi:hypothetical protein